MPQVIDDVLMSVAPSIVGILREELAKAIAVTQSNRGNRKYCCGNTPSPDRLAQKMKELSL
jgi:hypothetical protein